MLLAACINDGPISFPELVAVTGFSMDDLSSCLRELQRMFLVPRARLVEGEERYQVNVNTRLLVRKVLGASDIYRRVEAAQKAVAATLPIIRDRVAPLIRQAVFHVRNNDYEEAEALLERGLERYPNEPDLVGCLGFVYKAWKPSPRVTDAREMFKRAWQLKCKNEGTYKHWCRLELDEQEWTEAAKVAERGLKMMPESSLLSFLAGYGRQRLGRQLLAGRHTERAQAEFVAAQGHLQRALKSPGRVDPVERDLNSDVYRALVLNSECLNDRYKVQEYLTRWRNEHPDDPNSESEGERLARKYGLP